MSNTSPSVGNRMPTPVLQSLNSTSSIIAKNMLNNIGASIAALFSSINYIKLERFLCSFDDTDPHSITKGMDNVTVFLRIFHSADLLTVSHALVRSTNTAYR